MYSIPKITTIFAQIAFFVFLSVGQLMALPAFPGAEGAGADTVGGRGGKVIHVTNLNDSGKGSFRAAVEASGPRIVVFDVAGIITLEDYLFIDNPYLTIAGQTAPSGGITIRGYMIETRTHDIIFRYLRMRMGSKRGSSKKEWTTAGGGTSLILSSLGDNTSYNIIIDHVSFSWAANKSIALWSQTVAAHDITFQNNIIAEGLSYTNATSLALTGSNINPDEMVNIAFHHNFFAHGSNRFPLIKVKEAKVINNVIYNWQWWATSVYGNALVDIIGNMYKYGTSNTAGDYNFDFRRKTRIFLT